MKIFLGIYFCYFYPKYRPKTLFLYSLIITKLFFQIMVGLIVIKINQREQIFSKINIYHNFFSLDIGP